MDFQKIVDGMAAMTCIVSVEKLEDGGCGELRIVTGNKAYIDSIENPAPGAEMLTRTFTPNSLYTEYFTRDLNFEDFCYRSAVQKKCLHSYVHPERLPIWFNLTFLPLAADDGNISYCTYTMEMDFQPDTGRMSNLSSDIASQVLETALTLRGASDFRTGMNDVICEIRKLCKAEHCCILLMDNRRRTCSVLCESFAEDVEGVPMADRAGEDFFDIVATWDDVISGSNCLIAKNGRDMQVVRERSPRWYDHLMDAGARNLVLFPLKSHGDLLGYIWALNFDPDDAAKIKEALEVTTFILASEIANYLLLDRLHVMGSHDMLTTVMNRNEMNNVVNALGTGSEGESTSIGIIFADLNGLKTVNDTGGHDAGDALLRDAARVLLEVFDAHKIFRAGGDEFVVILTGIAEDELLEKAAAVRDAEKRSDTVSFAIGTCFDASSLNVHAALRTADARMYADKRAYYERHPELKRRDADNGLHC